MLYLESTHPQILSHPPRYGVVSVVGLIEGCLFYRRVSFTPDMYILLNESWLFQHLLDMHIHVVIVALDSSH